MNAMYVMRKLRAIKAKEEEERHGIEEECKTQVGTGRKCGVGSLWVRAKGLGRRGEHGAKGVAFSSGMH